jgi:hypothetical protein
MADLDLGVGRTVSYFFCANAREPDNNAAADTPPMKPRLLVCTELSSIENARTFPEMRRREKRKWKGRRSPAALLALSVPFRRATVSCSRRA